MDRRKLQRVALPAGLLFLILLAIGVLLHAAGEAVKAEDQQKLGALVREHPEYEDSYARIMGGDAPNETADLGAQIMEKYGYNARDGGAYRAVRQYLFLAGGILAGGVAAAFCVFTPDMCRFSIILSMFSAGSIPRSKIP